MNYITTFKTLKNVPELQDNEKLVIVAPADGALTVADLNKVLSLRDAIGDCFTLSTYTVDAEMILAMSAPLFTNATESFVLVDKELPLIEMFKDRLSYFEVENQDEVVQEVQIEEVPEEKVEILSVETEAVEDKKAEEASEVVVEETKTEVEEVKPKRRSTRRKKAETVEGEEAPKKRSSRRKKPSIEEKVATVLTEVVEGVAEEKPKTRRRTTKKTEEKVDETKEGKVSSRRKKPESKTVEAETAVEEKPKAKRRTSKKKDEINPPSEEKGQVSLEGEKSAKETIVFKKNVRKRQTPEVSFVQTASEIPSNQDAAEVRADLGKKVSELLNLDSKRYGFPMGDEVFPLVITQLIDESTSDEDVRVKLVKYDKGNELWGIVKEHIEEIRELLGR